MKKIRFSNTLWKKGVVSWTKDQVLYLSVPFTWMLGKAEEIAKEHDGKVVAGGPAVKLVGAPWADEVRDKAPRDVLKMHNPDATFTTRGCIRGCGFCAVPRIEGKFRELKRWKVRPVECSNNFLASSKVHIERVITSFLDLPWVDFNQGLDARIFTPWHAEQLARLKNPRVRFAFDYIGMESKVAHAIITGKKAGLSRFSVYVLIGFRDTPDDALYRLKLVRSWGVFPFPMRYQPLDCTEKNDYVGLGWDAETLEDMVYFYSRLVWFRGIKFEDYQDKMRDLRAKKKSHGRINKKKIQ